VKLYADRFGTRLRQLLTDVLVVIWVYIWIRLAVALHDLIDKLAAPGRKLAQAGDSIADNLRGAGGQADRIPGVGDDLAAPFNRAGDAARGLADAGREQQEIVHDVALAMSVALLVLPLGLVLFVWLPLRIRWIRRASAAAKLRGAGPGRDLLALRALATQPLTKLAALDPDIASAWRRGDADAVERLAALELRGLGLR